MLRLLRLLFHTADKHDKHFVHKIKVMPACESKRAEYQDMMQYNQSNL